MDLVVAVEIVRLQERKDAPAGPVADEGLLLRRSGAGAGGCEQAVRLS
jgi:hypothetical protein